MSESVEHWGYGLTSVQLTTLPSTISYSPQPLPSHLKINPILRRDLYDARFQLASGSNHDDSSEEDDDDDELETHRKDGSRGGEGDEWIDGDTDLIRGLYEGGLKTWEGGLDLVEVLSDISNLGKWVRGRDVLEVGLYYGPYLLKKIQVWVRSSLCGVGRVRYCITIMFHPSRTTGEYSRRLKARYNNTSTRLQSSGASSGHTSKPSSRCSSVCTA
jgi:hypothetical protein